MTRKRHFICVHVITNTSTPVEIAINTMPPTDGYETIVREVNEAFAEEIKNSNYDPVQIKDIMRRAMQTISMRFYKNGSCLVSESVFTQWCGVTCHSLVFNAVD